MGEAINESVTAFLARLIDPMDRNIELAIGRGAEIKRRDRGTANDGADHELSVDLQSGGVEQSIFEYRSHLCSPVWRFQCSPSCTRARPLVLGWRKVNRGTPLGRDGFENSGQSGDPGVVGKRAD
jgi:hypothetical protein